MSGGLSVDILSLAGIGFTIIAHLLGTVWWAASLTRRVEHAERWMTYHEHTAERLVALEQRLEGLTNGIERIERLLRQYH